MLYAVGLTHVQWHGPVGSDTLTTLRAATGLPVIAAHGVSTESDLGASALAPLVSAETLLFDAKPPQGADSHGGHGRAFDWSVLSAYEGSQPWLLAGGLTPDSVGAAVAAVGRMPGFAGVDVSSGVEQTRGVKDPRLITAFVHGGARCYGPSPTDGDETCLTTRGACPISFRNGPDTEGRFGIFGGRFVAETLMPLVLSLEKAYAAAKDDPAYAEEFEHLLATYVGRPSPLYFASRLTEHVRGSAEAGHGAKIYFKRDELNHTGAHKINNCLGQILLARRMGKTRIIAENGCRSARRGNRDRLRAVRSAVHGV